LLGPGLVAMSLDRDIRIIDMEKFMATWSPRNNFISDERGLVKADRWEIFKYCYDVLSENTNFHQASEQLLQQILQHFWSLNSGSQFTIVESIYDGESQSGTEESLKYCDESDFDYIRDHGGCNHGRGCEATGWKISLYSPQEYCFIFFVSS
jgi:hypothetical protein